MLKHRGTYLAILAAGIIPLLGFQIARDLTLELEEAPSRAPGAQNRWALVVGISNYRNLPPNAQLKYAHRDAEDFAQFLHGGQGGGFPSTQLQLLTQERATVSAIRAALHHWLPASAGPKDIVYLYLAGHGVMGEGGEAYFVANDSDPQNLHATALPFSELNAAIGKIKAAMVVVVADACHSGSIGFSGNPETLSNAHQAFDSIGARDRLVLKMLASRPNERSYEDEKWGGGHGIFTYSLLEGLRGAAEREPDGFIRTSELIDYVSRLVPDQTMAKQNPRIAGNFEPRLALALIPRQKKPAAAFGQLNILGQAGTSIYVDNVFRGMIRPSGDLRVEQVPVGPRTLSIDFPSGQSLEQTVTVAGAPLSVNINQLPGQRFRRLEALIAQGAILGQGGAWDFYRVQAQLFPNELKSLAAARMASALENLGQECVSDYVQSTSSGVKHQMLLRSAEALEALRTLRPQDRFIQARHQFCMGRANIAAGEFEQAEVNLRASLAIDNSFACAYNALGVALARLGRTAESRAAFESALQLTPRWSLPYWQVAGQLLAANKTKQALPYLEKAAQYNPRSAQVLWLYMRVARLLERNQDVERVAKDLIALDPNYPPTYLELASYYENRRDYAAATQALDTYLLLAPNFADSAQVRARANQLRPFAQKKPPNTR